MPTLWQQNLSGVSNRWLSPALWSDCPRDLIIAGWADGFRDGDDFKFGMAGEDAADDTATVPSYDRYIHTSNTIRITSVTETNYFGSVALITDATDNDGPVLHRVVSLNAAGSNVTAPYVISDTAGSAFPLWFEGRYKVSSVTDDIISHFFGLASGILDTRAADNGVLEDDTGALVDSVAFLGFGVQHTNGGTTGANAALDFCYQDSAATTPVIHTAALATLVADTYFKVGFKFLPQADASQRITIYYNGIPVTSSYVTAAQIAAATFPDGDMMGFVVGSKNGTAGASTLTCDWWECVQLYAPAVYD